MPRDRTQQPRGRGRRPRAELPDEATWHEAIQDIEEWHASQTARYGHAKRQAEWRHRFHEKGQEDLAQRMQWEIDASELMSRPLYEKTESYFRALCQWSDGTSWPRIDEFPDEQLDYLEERAISTPNPMLEARYSDIVWERRQKHEFARRAVGAYLASVEHYLQLGWGIEMQKALARAIELCLLLNDDKLLARPLKLLRKLLSHFTAAADPRWGLELAQIAISLPSKTWTGALERAVQRYLRRAVEHYSSPGIGNPSLEQSALDILATLHRRSGDAAQLKTTMRRKALSHEREAEERESAGNNLAAAHLYGDALAVYQQVGDAAKVNDLQLRIRECNRKGASEFGVISAEIKIPAEDMERMISFYADRDIADALKLLAQSFIESMEKVRQQVKETTQQHQLLSILPIATYADDRLVGRALSDADIFEQNVIRQLLFSYTFNAELISEVIRRLVSKGMQTGDLVEFLAGSPALSGGRRDVLERGVERYLAGDYMSSIHVLVPELEHALRSILPRLGRADTVADQATGVMKVKLLDTVLRELKKDVLGDDLYGYFYTMLVDQDGANIRNDVAHGLMPPSRFDQTTASTLLHMLLILTRLRFVAVDTGEAGKENQPRPPKKGRRRRKRKEE